MATGINFDDAHQYNHPDNPIVATVSCTECGAIAGETCAARSGHPSRVHERRWADARCEITGREQCQERRFIQVQSVEVGRWRTMLSEGVPAKSSCPSVNRQVLLPETPSPPIAWRRLPSDTSRSIRLVRRIRTVFCGGTAMVLGLGKPNRPGAIYVMDKLAGVLTTSYPTGPSDAGDPFEDWRRYKP